MKVNVSDRELLQKAREGDFEAFAELTEPYRGNACEFLSRLVGEDLAEDVFMKATLNAWRALKSFSGKSSYKTWLFSIARYAALDELRKKKSRNEVSTDDEESVVAINRLEDPTTPTPAESLESEERNRIIEKALEQLPETHRSVLVLYYYQDFQYSEIAETLEISIGTVMSRLHHAKKKLEKVLKQYKEDLF